MICRLMCDIELRKEEGSRFATVEHGEKAHDVATPHMPWRQWKQIVSNVEYACKIGTLHRVRQNVRTIAAYPVKPFPIDCVEHSKP
jgi:hypothetical protein